MLIWAKVLVSRACKQFLKVLFNRFLIRQTFEAHVSTGSQSKNLC
jgi:hypothetical protein